jgi:putative mycofactocin binding protein MftB
MASVECTERQASQFRTPDWIRVRPEGFGLLFYDTRSTRLTFVRSDGLLERRHCTMGGQPLTLVEAVTSDDARVDRVLQKLVDKGLLVAVPPGGEAACA